jgi:hypothetical protein
MGQIEPFLLQLVFSPGRAKKQAASSNSIREQNSYFYYHHIF